MTYLAMLLCAVSSMNGVSIVNGNGPKIVGSSTMATRRIQLPDNINEVDVRNGGICEIVQGESPELVITANENALEYITADVSTSAVNLRGIVATGSYENIDIRYHVVLSSALSRIAASRGAGVEAQIKTADKLEVSLSDGSRMILKGACAHFYAQLSNASKLDAEQFEAQTADIQASNASRCTIGRVVQKFIGKGFNASTILYGGNPSVVQATAKSASQVGPC